MPKQTEKTALEYICWLEAQCRSQLCYARRLIQGRSRAKMIRVGTGYCDFAGHLLVTVVDRKTEAAVYIQDSDDWNIELTVANVKKAEKVFDDLFHDSPEFTPAFAERLRQFGFCSK